MGGGTQAGSSAKSAKKERFFWQYNVQSKGPKGQRLVLSTKQEDPHCLNEITDPVFSPGCSLQGIKHRYDSVFSTSSKTTYTSYNKVS